METGSNRDLIGMSGFFDAEWYRQTHGIDIEPDQALDHYIAEGWKRGFSPGPGFDAAYYLNANPDVQAFGMEPLEHFLRYGARERRLPFSINASHDGEAKILTAENRARVAGSALFDAEWYRANAGLGDDVDPLEHYLTKGWRNRLSPSAAFDVDHYLSAYPDVAAVGIEPLTHYLLHGAAEGRQTLPQWNSIRELAVTAVLLDPVWYRAQYDHLLNGADPVDHYFGGGWRIGCSPSVYFDSAFYLSYYRDIFDAGIEPLEHYIRYGAMEGRKPVSDERAADLDLVGKIHGEEAILALSDDRNGPTSVGQLLAQPLTRFVAGHARGRRVWEIGLDWTPALERVVANLAEGAIESRIVELHRNQMAEGRLRLVGKRVGQQTRIAAYLARFEPEDGARHQPIWAESATKKWVARADIWERDLKNKLGEVGLLVATAAVDEAYDIIKLLRRYAEISDDLVIFTTSLTAPFSLKVDSRSVHFGRNDIWLAEDMDAARSRAMAVHLHDHQRLLAQYDVFPDGFRLADTQRRGLGGVCWWFYGIAGLATLLRLAGLELVEHESLGDGQKVAVLARRLAEPEGSIPFRTRKPIR